ncbi:MAG: ABC transporter ATP-binding protein [Chloroflexi bacterium]|nr:ABC transporter ATP-binding protein [Ardenticatenaceae bacterium]MBL1127954.1 ABC transporter ATP-binding protein [Chloroflexota bacterium]NOG34025.1 ABC transporter ATP-binding protein [Chloroflexota bacterium]GIK54439.1 MAG: ABC transporter ATP-binding protein [Chloroflexota bacterium]
MSIVKTEQLTKVYGQGATAVTALNRINMTIQPGEFVAVMGPSGCGKSTLLHLVGGLDQPTSGQVLLDDRSLSGLKDDDLTTLRRRQIGFVFQFFNLIPVLTAVENTALPLILDGMKQADAHNQAEVWLTRMGLGDRLSHRPDELSGGQQQRVAIARALVAEPTLLLADEPTGNLDSRAADEIAALLRQISHEWHRTVLMVTHDPRIAAHANRIVFLKDGTIVDDTRLSDDGQYEERVVREKMAVMA